MASALPIPGLGAIGGEILDKMGGIDWEAVAGGMSAVQGGGPGVDAQSPMSVPGNAPQAAPMAPPMTPQAMPPPGGLAMGEIAGLGDPQQLLMQHMRGMQMPQQR